ncbi:MAG TPA: SRPBCC family protein [Solirubrobacteraceae bacterium]|jgi:uncharacterized protein YndB with AHSA1/START domain
MPDDRNHAELQEQDGRWVLVFERVLPHSRERVWRALTERSELDAWHPTPFDFEATSGGHVSFQVPPVLTAMPDGHVIEYEPPRLLAHTWFEDELRWELSEHPDGCRLTLAHRFDDRFKAARDGAGWHLCLQALEQSLAGTAATAAAAEGTKHHDDERLPAGWNELNEEYQRRFGISPEQATPPPSA